jgi:hypothetical protein
MIRVLAVRLAAASAFVAVLGAPLVARATPSFPGDVQTHYGLSGPPFPPNGCQLCHQDDNGGDPTTLRPFGRLLYTQFHVQAYDDDSLRTALGELDTQYMNLADDIATGKDPNVDLSGGEGGIANPDPIPMYGCAVGAGSAAGHRGVALAFAALAAMAVYRPKRKTNPSQPRAR